MPPPGVHTKADEIGHFAFAAKDQSAILIDNECNLFAAKTCQKNSIGADELAILKEALCSVNFDFAIEAQAILIEVIEYCFDPLNTGLVFVVLEIHYGIVDFVETCKFIIREIDTILIEGKHCAINKVRTFKFNAVYVVGSVVCVPTVCGNNAIKIFLAICEDTIEQFSAVFAGEFAIGIDSPIMAQCGNLCSPINNRIANCAVCAACVTTLGAGSGNICYCGNSMLVPADLCCCLCINPILSACNVFTSIVGKEDFCIYNKIFHAKSAQSGGFIILHIGNNATLESKLNSFLPNNTSADKSCRSLIFIAIILSDCRFPCTDREGSKNSFAYLGIFANTGNGNESEVIVFLNIPRSFKAFSNFHSFEFPLARVVEIKCHFNLFDGLDIGCDNVHPIEGSYKRTIYIRVLGNDLDCGRSIRCCCNVYLTACPRGVACVISNFKANIVNAIGKSNTGDGHFSVFKAAIDLFAINISSS